MICYLFRRCAAMEQKELEYLRQVEDHASRTGWVSPLTREDKEYFAYLRQVSKRYNIDMSKAAFESISFNSSSGNSSASAKAITVGFDGR